MSRNHPFEADPWNDSAISITPSLGVKLCEGNPVAAFRHSYGREANHLRQTMQTPYLLQQDMAVTVTRGNPLSVAGTTRRCYRHSAKAGFQGRIPTAPDQTT